jgi:hypothetical protein
MGGNSKKYLSLAQPGRFAPARDGNAAEPNPGRVDRVVRHLTDRESAINACVNVLAHTLSHPHINGECEDARCQKMQSVLRHVSKCAIVTTEKPGAHRWFERAQNARARKCKVCIQFMDLQIFHAKRCRNTRCCFKFCEPLKTLLVKILQNRLQKSKHERNISNLCCPQFPLVDLKTF